MEDTGLMSLSSRIPGTVYSRTDAGMPETPGGAYRDLSAVDRWVTHWTTGDALGTPDTVEWVHNIYHFHTGNRGWADIGYNYLVDRFGNVFVGRGRHRRGAHAPGWNQNGMGVAYLGGKAADVSKDGKKALLGLYEWLVTEGGVTIPESHRFGHRDISQTSCPGDLLYQWTHAGMPMPRSDDPEPEPQDPEDTTPDYIVAVIADNDVDEGMARVLGKAYLWKFLHADDLGGVHIGTAVRVGAAAHLDGPWDETHDVGGSGRDETAKLVMERIRADEGSSRSVT